MKGILTDMIMESGHEPAEGAGGAGNGEFGVAEAEAEAVCENEEVGACEDGENGDGACVEFRQRGDGICLAALRMKYIRLDERLIGKKLK